MKQTDSINRNKHETDRFNFAIKSQLNRNETDRFN